MLLSAKISYSLDNLSSTFLHLFRHGSTEHQHLLVVRSLHKNVLNITSHLGIAENLITLVDHKKFGLNHKESTLEKLISLCLARS